VTPRAAAVALCVSTVLLTAALVTLAVILALDSSYEPDQSLLTTLSDVPLVLPFAIVGALLVVKRPGNLVGWSLSLAGIGLLVGGVLGAYAELALLAKPEAGLPGGGAAGALVGGSWTPLMAGVFLLLVYFPDGRLPSPRWRTVTLLVLLGFALTWLVISTAPGDLDSPLENYENPLAVTQSKAYVLVLVAVIPACLICLVLAGISLVLRFRRSHGLERQQFKWLAASTAFLVLTLPFAAAFHFSEIAGAVFAVALMALPVSVGIAVLRYRLYDLDLIVRRTLVYGVLTAGLGGLYFAIVLGLQELFSSFAGGSDLAIAGSTLIVAALFRPARRRVQALVDRRFYRHKYDAERTLQAFAARLRDEVDLDALRTELTSVVAETMQPAHVSLWLRQAS
jgi:hypothetical protein